MKIIKFVFLLLISTTSVSQNDFLSVNLNYFYELKDNGQLYSSDINNFTNTIDLGKMYIDPEFAFDSIGVDRVMGRLKGKVKQLIPKNNRDSYGLYLGRIIDGTIVLDTLIFETNINEYQYFDLHFNENQKLILCLKRDDYYSVYYDIGELYKNISVCLYHIRF